jgi:hypothetical protein
VATGSLAVVLTSVAFLIAPTSPAVAATVRTGTGASSTGEVIYGRVTNAVGHPSKHARVALRHRANGRMRTDAVTFTAADGSYRMATGVTPGSYRVTFTARVHGRNISGNANLNLRRGVAYDVSGRIVHQSVFRMLPISTY